MPGNFDSTGGVPGASGQSVPHYQVTYTWGLQATGAHASSYSGKGARIAVLDTGIGEAHADFVGRITQTRSFMAGIASVQDGDGHGTHVAGTIARLSVGEVNENCG